MFDTNSFKKQVKDWMKQNPEATVAELVDFCEELIPPAQYASYQWLVEQTANWYGHVLSHRETSERLLEDPS